MKKVIVILLIATMSIFALCGCAKCISTEYENVEVNIVGEYHRGMYVTPLIVGKLITTQTHPAVYQINVEYNGIEYTINGSDTYNKYKDKVGNTVIGTLEIRTYDDGSVRYDIVSLE